MSQLILFIALSVVVAAFVRAAVLSYRRNRLEPEEAGRDEEWDCPECGFHVQAAEICIYCGSNRPSPGQAGERQR